MWSNTNAYRGTYEENYSDVARQLNLIQDRFNRFPRPGESGANQFDADNVTLREISLSLASLCEFLSIED